MTRRQRINAIIEAFGGLHGHGTRHAVATVMARHGLNAFTDAAIEDLARELLAGRRLQQRLNRENRARLGRAA